MFHKIYGLFSEIGLVYLPFIRDILYRLRIPETKYYLHQVLAYDAS